MHHLFAYSPGKFRAAATDIHDGHVSILYFKLRHRPRVSKLRHFFP